MTTDIVREREDEPILHTEHMWRIEFSGRLQVLVAGAVPEVALYKAREWAKTPLGTTLGAREVVSIEGDDAFCAILT